MVPKVLVLRTAGTNCDYETEHAFQLVGAETSLIHINRLIVGAVRLDNYQIMVIPGGFSYGDDISAGILLANEVKHELGHCLRNFIDSGKLIIGICNGFQVLVRAGLLPRLNSQGAQEATLTMNTSAKFECRWVYLETQDSPCVFTKGLKRQLYLPVAHAEGNFAASKHVLNKIESNQQIVFRYASAKGSQPTYPENPNGSALNIAGLCDQTGRIFGMMPHPERFLSRFNHPRWTREHLCDEGDGLEIFQNAVAYVKANFLAD